jgi:hypothetical protein
MKKLCIRPSFQVRTSTLPFSKVYQYTPTNINLYTQAKTAYTALNHRDTYRNILKMKLRMLPESNSLLNWINSYPSNKGVPKALINLGLKDLALEYRECCLNYQMKSEKLEQAIDLYEQEFTYSLFKHYPAYQHILLRSF